MKKFFYYSSLFIPLYLSCDGEPSNNETDQYEYGVQKLFDKNPLAIDFENKVDYKVVESLKKKLVRYARNFNEKFNQKDDTKIEEEQISEIIEKIFYFTIYKLDYKNLNKKKINNKIESYYEFDLIFKEINKFQNLDKLNDRKKFVVALTIFYLQNTNYDQNTLNNDEQKRNQYSEIINKVKNMNINSEMSDDLIEKNMEEYIKKEITPNP